MNDRDSVIQEVEEEMNRTDDNVDDPTFWDYVADVHHRLEFMLEAQKEMGK